MQSRLLAADFLRILAHRALMLRPVTGLIGLGLLAGAIGWTSVAPSHERDWRPEQRLLPRATITRNHVTIRNVRDFRWGPGGEMRRAWTERTYDLDALASVWYVLTPFSRDRRGPAHAFVSFGFDDGRFLAISVEARRESGEAYSIRRGMLKRYEIMYVIGDERDLIQQRVARDDDVYVYPVRASPEQIRSLFIDMLLRANDLRQHPEFYGTLRNNCTTNLLAHVNTIARAPIRYGPRVLLPGYSDEVAHERGLIDTDLPLDAARERFLVNAHALGADARDDYSFVIRRLPAGSPVLWRSLRASSAPASMP
ncbi:MAG TPA: DUF4105 domain-containing protein [Longimicrobiales bacterium]